MINDEKKLCGKITIDISGKVSKEKYLYLYNNEKEKYQKIETKDLSTLIIDTAGKYLLTSKTLTGLSVNIEQNKKKKTVQRMLLGVIVSLVFVFCVDAILWAVGALGTTNTVRLVFILDLIFMISIEVILWAIGFGKTGKK